MGWEFDAGPVHLSEQGIAIKPQMKIGYSDGNVAVRAGVEDVRNGLSAAVAGDIHRVYKAKGTGLKKVLQELKNDSEVRVIDDIMSSAPELLAKIMRTAKVRILENSQVDAKVTIKAGLGVSGAACLGWANTDGFHMVGVQGSISAAVGIGADMMVGRHATENLVKCILGFSNLCMELVFETVPCSNQQHAEGMPDEQVSPIADTEQSFEAEAMAMTM